MRYAKRPGRPVVDFSATADMDRIIASVRAATRLPKARGCGYNGIPFRHLRLAKTERAILANRPRPSNYATRSVVMSVAAVPSVPAAVAVPTASMPAPSVVVASVEAEADPRAAVAAPRIVIVPLVIRTVIRPGIAIVVLTAHRRSVVVDDAGMTVRLVDAAAQAG